MGESRREYLAAEERAKAAAQGAETSGDDTGPSPDERLRALARQVARWQGRFEGRQFRLPAQQAANLMKTREDYLAGSR